MTSVAVFGTGYVGCVTGACLSRDGHNVIGVDIDDEKVALLNAGHAPVSEPGLENLVQQQVVVGRLRATADYEQAIAETQMAMIAVGTPSDRAGAVAISAVEKVIQSIGRALRNKHRPYSVVVRSTLLPGILEDRLAPLLSEAANCELGSQLKLCNNPEFLRESSAIRDYDAPPFIVAGTIDGADALDVRDLYKNISSPFIETDSRTAALLKYGCNAYHALKVAFANEMGSLACSFGADGHRVMELLCRDTKLNVSPAYLRPGFSFGGSCLPKDIRALTRYAEEQAIRVNLLQSVLPSNQEHLQRAIGLIEDQGIKQIGLIGLSFKAGTDDLRESPYVTLIETLIGRGYDVKIYDPNISLTRLRGMNRTYVDQHLPHLAALLLDDVVDLFSHASLLILGNDVADDIKITRNFNGKVIDLRRSLVVSDGQLS